MQIPCIQWNCFFWHDMLYATTVQKPFNLSTGLIAGKVNWFAANSGSPLMSLLIWYQRIPLYFRLLLLSLCCGYPSHTTHHCNILCDTCEPAQSLASHCPTLIGPITNHTISPASHIECTCDLQTLLLHFPFLMSPHIVFWWYAPCFTLPICHHDTW